MSTYLIRPYGETHWHDLRLPGLNAVLAANGFGIPEIEYQTQRGYKQHGHIVKDWRLRPRKVNLTLHVAGDDFKSYRASRQQVWNLVRPNKGGALTIRRIDRDGTTRDVDCWFSGGGDGSDSPDTPITHNEILPLEFTCPNPSFYDPLSQTASITGTTPVGLVFPAAFGLVRGTGTWVFHAHDELGQAAISYPGTFRSYPVITVTGPYTTMKLVNNATGAEIVFGVAREDGESLTIDIEAQTVVDTNGVDCFTDLSTANLVDFYLKPDESNSILVEATDSDTNTSATIEYYERYIAL